jgi:hypothetical protein
MISFHLNSFLMEFFHYINIFFNFFFFKFNTALYFVICSMCVSVFGLQPNHEISYKSTSIFDHVLVSCRQDGTNGVEPGTLLITYIKPKGVGTRQCSRRRALWERSGSCSLSLSLSSLISPARLQ